MAHTQTSSFHPSFVSFHSKLWSKISMDYLSLRWLYRWAAVIINLCHFLSTFYTYSLLFFSHLVFLSSTHLFLSPPPPVFVLLLQRIIFSPGESEGQWCYTVPQVDYQYSASTGHHSGPVCPGTHGSVQQLYFLSVCMNDAVRWFSPRLSFKINVSVTL